MMDWPNIYRMAKPWLWSLAGLLWIMMFIAMAQWEMQEQDEPTSIDVSEVNFCLDEQVIEIVKHDPDPYDRFVMNMDRRHAERVMDIMIASGGYADLPDIVDLEDGRVEIIALRSTE